MACWRDSGGRVSRDNVVSEDEVSGFAAHADARRVACEAVVFDQVVVETIAVPGHAQRLVAEDNAILPVRANLVVADQVVRVFMADGDAVAAVILDNVLLEQPMPDARRCSESCMLNSPGPISTTPPPRPAI